MIKNVKLFINNNEKSFSLGKLVKESFSNSGFNIVDNNFQLGIAIGGDGAFIRMVKNSCFNENPYYVGINSGTLGFLQEVKDNEVKKLIYEIKNNKFKVDEIGVQETSVRKINDISRFYSLNEISVREKNLDLLKLDVLVDGAFLESFAGDGILVATSLGSTAQNRSYGGSIVYPNFSTLQITPMGLNDSSVYKSLKSSVIVPSGKDIILKPVGDRNNLIVKIDGENKIYENTLEIATSIKDKKIKCLRFSNYSFPQKINEKLLSNKK